MKKGVKAALYVSVVCILSGAIMTGIGALAGGYDQLDEMNSHFEYDAVSHWNLPWSYEGGKKEAGKEVYSGDFEKDIDCPETLRNLEVEVGTHGVEIEEGAGPDIHVQGVNCDKIQVYIKNDTLYLKDVEKKKLPVHDPIGKKDRYIVLTVPSGKEWEEASLSADMGYIEMDALRACKAELDADMGSIEIETVSAGEMDIEADMGSVELSDARIGKLDMSADMGSITVYGIVEGDIEAEADMGSIEMTLAQEETDFNYEITASMGSVSINRSEFSGLDQEKAINHGALKKMELDSSMGSIEILFD